MHRDHRLYLDDILEAISKIREYTTGLDYSAFVEDSKTQDAVVRNLEIIGEAAGRLPEPIRLASRKLNGARSWVCVISWPMSISGLVCRLSGI